MESRNRPRAGRRTLSNVARRTDPETVIRAQVVLEEHDLAADGRFAIVVRRFVHRDRYRSHLWLVPLVGGGRPIQLTSGGVRDASPRVSPDGTSVAFRRTLAAARLRDARAGSDAADPDTSRLRVLPIGTDGRPGRPWAIRTPKGRSVGEIAWSPDGSRIALTLDAGSPRFIVGPEPRAGDEPLARRITRIDWRMDEVGHVDRWSHLHVVEAKPGAAPIQVTDGDWGVSGIAWAPDGASIAFAADPRPAADLAPRRSIWTVPAGGDSAPREVISLGGDAHSPAWSPNGRWIAATGYVPEGATDDVSPELVLAPADGSGPPRRLAPGLDRPIGNWVDTDLHGWTASSRPGPFWLDDRSLVAIVSDRARAVPWRFPIDAATGGPAGDPAPLATGNIAAHSLGAVTNATEAAGTRITFVATVDGRPMELLTAPVDGAPVPTAPARPATPAVRTRLGGAWSAGFAWPEMRSIQVPGPGGPIETWVASPARAAAGPLPTIVDVHGGPLGAWAPAPSIEVVLLCARGYRVLLPNIRGSTTYGGDWIRPQLGDWGGVDATDVHAAVDHAVAAGLADPARLGVLGLSYGGFMVNWLVSTSSRFRAAVSENGVTNQVSSWAASDTGVDYNRMAMLGAPLDEGGGAKLWGQSPLARCAGVRTPLLILQGEADRRCPPSDSEQLFIALRVLGRTVEYVLYPEESHVYQAAGRPDRRIDRMTRVLDWFDRYLRA
jgi:dipeptidyl aminopeptidase/acylaminoacyl peptidase